MSTTTPYYNGVGAQVIAYSPNNQEIGQMDCVTIEYTESQNKLPIYGYKSFLYDEVLYGAVLIQGTFLLNKSESVTMHKAIKKGAHPETENFAVKFSVEDSLLTQSKFVIQIKHFNKSVLLDNAKWVGKEYKVVFNIDNVELTGVRQAIQADGNPIGEFYDFVGKRMVDTPAKLQDLT